MKVLSVVCARAGSKGLRNKCIAMIKNKMVIEYSIEYSLSLSKGVKTVVSTDIAEVIDYCKANNIEYIRRDPKFCEDKVRIDGAIADAIEKTGSDCDYFSLVYGNIPTRYPGIFHEALRFLKTHMDYDAVMSMQNVEKFHPEWMYDYDEEILLPQKETQYRRQALPQKMVHDGHTFIFKSKEFHKRFNGIIPYDREYANSIYGNKIKPLITDKAIVDIDTERDLQLAEAIIASRLSIQKR